MGRAPVLLEEYDSSWTSKFEEEKDHLMAIAGEWHYGSIEHVGSTAVPCSGLCWRRYAGG